VSKRLNMLRHLQEVDIESLDEGLELLERVKTNTSSAQDRERVAHLIRVTAEVTDHIRGEPDKQAPPVSQRPSAQSNSKRKRQLSKAARRRQRVSAS
jgi:hypothetical protein